MHVLLIVTASILVGLAFFGEAGGFAEWLKWLPWGRVPYVAASFVFVTVAAWLSGVAVWVAPVAGLLWLAVMTLARGPTLSGPSQKIVLDDSNDKILGFLCHVFQKMAGDDMGLGMWVTYNVLRYVIPVGAVGLCFGTPLGFVAGAIIPFAIYRICNVWVSAGLAGAVSMALLLL